MNENIVFGPISLKKDSRRFARAAVGLLNSALALDDNFSGIFQHCVENVQRVENLLMRSGGWRRPSRPLLIGYRGQ